MFSVSGAGDLLGIAVSLTIPSLVAALCINGVGIGGQQVVGVVDALHEASRAGYPENAATQGLVAGMWSSLSGAGRYTSCTHACNTLTSFVSVQVCQPRRLWPLGGRLRVLPCDEHRVRSAAGGGPGDLPIPGDLRVQPRGQGERPQVGGRDHSGAREAEGGPGEIK